MKVKEAGANISGQRVCICRDRSTNILISKDQYHLNKININTHMIKVSLEFQKQTRNNAIKKTRLN